MLKVVFNDDQIEKATCPLEASLKVITNYKPIQMSNYLKQLDELLQQRVNELSENFKKTPEKEAKVPPMSKLLGAAMKNEWETTLLTCLWVGDEKDADLRVSLARLAGDEAKHYHAIEKRLHEMGASIDPAELDQRTPLFHFLKEQTTTQDRVICGPYTREALAVQRNQVFLDHCQNENDQKTIELYQEIQSDEAHHHELGRKHLEQWLRSEEDFNHARQKVDETLKVIDDIQEMAMLKLGVCNLPGC